MDLRTIRSMLLNFIKDPDICWGVPSDGWGNPTSINEGHKQRVAEEQSDRNTARLQSGTYTEGQYAQFQAQLGEVEASGAGTAYFPGDPDSLPDSLPERICSQCRRTFRTSSTGEEFTCYRCVLDRLCPTLPGTHIKCYWTRDGWRMEAHGDIGFRNELTFWWHNTNSGGNASHQGLVVYRNAELKPVKLIFSTVASYAGCSYEITFDLESGRQSYRIGDHRDVQPNNPYTKWRSVEDFEPIVLDLIEAMLPNWMLYQYRPRSSYGYFTVE